MNCYICGQPANQNRPARTIDPEALPHMKKLKPNAKKDDKFELCDECYPKVFPQIKLTVPAPHPALIERQKKRKEKERV